MRTLYLRNCCAAFSAATISILLPSIAHARVIISEVQFDPQHADDRHEWIELFNDGSEPADISKWTFSDGSSGTKHALNAPPKNGGAGSLSIGPGEYLVIADDAATFAADVPGIAHIIDSAMSLPNPSAGTSVTVTLFDEKKQVADTCTYTGGLIAKGSGDSAQRIGNGIAGAVPTPGAPNASAPRQAAKPVGGKEPSAVIRVKTNPRSRASAESLEPETISREAAPQPAEEAIPIAAAVADATQQAKRGSVSPWLYGGAGAVTLGAAVAAAVARHKKRDEWDIIDAAEDA